MMTHKCRWCRETFVGRHGLYCSIRCMRLDAKDRTRRARERKYLREGRAIDKALDSMSRLV